ncbi:M3 family oligoendopeptidase [Candidatus Phytoplasma pruni]|uniref:M3 family oligoendopeptidase n=1 Tax=Candidatus Phytoplasma pruni TaxID=479893 RepID=A0A851HD92_9MOLU|nr:M3 family oligoendopeptidase [Candidatus Phytoplasma pruni]NWN46035.1 M3 family oligoendopeptidase [Candidatus Phytoplasma pruni]
MKFSQFPYQRPNMEEIKKNILPIIEKFLDYSLEEQIKSLKEVNQITDEINSMATLASIRNSVNTKDPFYQEEQAFWDHNGPLLSEWQFDLSQKMVQSKHYEGLVKEFGALLLQKTHLFLKTFDAKIIPFLQKENALTTEYEKLIADPSVNFRGKQYNLSQMATFLSVPDRNTRKEAQLAISAFFEKNEKEYDRIYDNLVQVRNEMARLLGYENFVQLGYDRLGRVDYNIDHVASYRENILTNVLPFYRKTLTKKSRRIGIDKLQSYDAKFNFLSGNPTPKGGVDFQVEQAKKMYAEMSEETNQLFNLLVDKELLELESKPNKVGGGYCTYLPKFQSPFVFANFNGTSHDVDVLTHEMGHAFQVYQSRHLIPEYRFPTLEAAEIHSMGMEFLAWPWMHHFFKEDSEKYKFSHLSESLNFLLYGALVDHFQHEVYQKPAMTPEERKQVWHELEQKYLPLQNFEEDKFLQKGTYWYRQGHIFSSPFYYIDYTLAQVAALEIWSLSQENYPQTWQLYLSLCQKGGSESFVNLLKNSGLNNPFEKDTLKNIAVKVDHYLDQINDEKF